MTAPESSAYTGPDAAAKALVDELSEILREFSEQCAIIGGMAHNFWREPRYTKDVATSRWLLTPLCSEG